MTFFFKLATHEITSLLSEAVKESKRGRLENSTRNRLLDHANLQGSIRYRQNRLEIEDRSFQLRHEIKV